MIKLYYKNYDTMKLKYYSLNPNKPYSPFSDRKGLRAGSHGVPSHLRLIPAISTVESMEVGAYHCTQGPCYKVPSHNHDMHAYMATLFGGEASNLCCELGQAKS